MPNVDVVPDASSASAVLGGAPPMTVPPNTAGLQPAGSAAPPAGAAMGGIAPQPQPPVHDRNFASKIFGALADVLGGKTGTQVGPDGTVTHPELSRTQQFSRILGNAMGGFSAGAQVHGPGAALGSIGAGFQAQQAQQQQQAQQVREQQKEAFDQDQKKILTKATVAEANSRATANAFTAYHTGMEIDQGLQAQASIARQPFVDSDQPATKEHITDSEIHDGMKDGSIDPTSHAAFIDGSKPQIGPDGKTVMDPATGKPVMEPTYAVYNTKGDVNLTPEATTELTKFIPGFRPPGDGKMKASDYYSLSKKVETQQYMWGNAASVRKEFGVKETPDNNLTALQKDPRLQAAMTHFQTYLNQAGGDPLKALQAMNSTKMSGVDPKTGMAIPGADVSGTETTNPDAKYSGAVIRAYGGIDTIQAKSAAIAAKAEATKTTVVGAASTAVDVSKQAALLPGQLKQAAMEARVKQPFEIAKLKAAQAIQDGDPAAAGHLLASGTVAPSQIISSRKPEFATKAFQAAAAEAKAEGRTWNSQKAEADYNVAKSPAMATFFGSANSLLDKGGTLDQLVSQHAKLGHGKDSIPVFNKLEDYANYASGKPALAGFIQTALGASDDYAKVMGGGQGSDSARLELMKSFTHAHNNGQMQAAVDAAKAAVGSQTSARVGRNPVLKQMYGQDSGAAASPAELSPAAQALIQKHTGQ